MDSLLCHTEPNKKQVRQQAYKTQIPPYGHSIMILPYGAIIMEKDKEYMCPKINCEGNG